MFRWLRRDDQGYFDGPMTKGEIIFFSLYALAWIIFIMYAGSK